MKRVAPTEIKGSYCLRIREGKTCSHLLDATAQGSFCQLYHPQKLEPEDVGRFGLLPMKCPRCVDALAELEDR